MYIITEIAPANREFPYPWTRYSTIPPADG